MTMTDKSSTQEIERLDAYWDDRDAQTALPGSLTAAVDALHIQCPLPKPRTEFVAALEARLFSTDAEHPIQTGQPDLSTPVLISSQHGTQSLPDARFSRRR